MHCARPNTQERKLELLDMHLEWVIEAENPFSGRVPPRRSLDAIRRDALAHATQARPSAQTLVRRSNNMPEIQVEGMQVTFAQL